MRYNKLILWESNRAERATMVFIIEEAEETNLDFAKRTVNVLWFYFVLI